MCYKGVHKKVWGWHRYFSFIALTGMIVLFNLVLHFVSLASFVFIRSGFITVFLDCFLLLFFLYIIMIFLLILWDETGLFLSPIRGTIGAEVGKPAVLREIYSRNSQPSSTTGSFA